MGAENRASSLLSQKQREFLEGKTDFGPMDSPGRTRRSRLRSRIEDGIQDVRYIADPDMLDDRDLDLILDDSSASQELVEGLTEMIAFVYRARPGSIESIIEEGLKRGVNRTAPGYAVNHVSIQINKQGPILESAREKMDESEPLSGEEVIALLQSGDIEADEVEDYVSSQPEPDDRGYGGRFRTV